MYEKNDTVYKQGDPTNSFDFYLLRGSVTLVSSKPDFGHFHLYTRSFYDGASFGSLPLFHELVRDASCICNEKCWVLRVPEQVKEQVDGDRGEEFQRQLEWLGKVRMFEDISVDKFHMGQIAAGMERRRYKLGERLVKTGEVPEGMVIVTKG